MSQDTLILVVGATGQQGGAVARHLLRNGIAVRALTRNANSNSAKSLITQGAHIVVGNLNDEASLNRTLEGVSGVFSVQNYWEKGVGYEGEIQQAKRLADSAKRAGVQHFVQSTMADAKNFQGVRHFESKREIEKYIDSIGLPRTFIGTVFFMDNLLDPKKGGRLTFPTLSGSLNPTTLFQLIAVDDIGAITAQVFQNPQRFIGKKINVAGDCLSIGQMKEVYRRTVGKEARAFSIPAWLLKILNREFAHQLQWHNDTGWDFSLDEAKSVHPQMTTFGEFLLQHKITNL